MLASAARSIRVIARHHNQIYMQRLLLIAPRSKLEPDAVHCMKQRPNSHHTGGSRCHGQANGGTRSRNRRNATDRVPGAGRIRRGRGVGRRSEVWHVFVRVWAWVWVRVRGRVEGDSATSRLCMHVHMHVIIPLPPRVPPRMCKHTVAADGSLIIAPLHGTSLIVWNRDHKNWAFLLTTVEVDN